MYHSYRGGKLKKLPCHMKNITIIDGIMCSLIVLVPKLEGCIVVNKRNVTRKFKIYSIMAIPNLGQDVWPIKKKGNRQLLLFWPNLIPYS